MEPGGAARHYGHVQTPREETVKDEFTAGYTNVAYGKNAYQISTRSGKTASLANDGNMNQYWGTGSCTLTNNNNNPYWYVDLGEEMSINDIALMGCTSNNWGQLTDGTYIGVSTTECWSTEEGCMETTTGVTVGF